MHFGKSFILTLVDISVTAWLLYLLLQYLNNKRVFLIVVGLTILFLLNSIGKSVGLVALSWLLDNFTTYFSLVVLILFRDEIKRALSQIGRSAITLSSIYYSKKSFLDEVVNVIEELKSHGIGAFFIIQGADSVNSLISNGIELNTTFSKSTVVTLLMSPLKNGAMLVHDGRILRAGVTIPNIESEDTPLSPKKLAALSVSKNSDAVSIVTTESGEVLAFKRGKIVDLSENLRAELTKLLQETTYA